MIDKPLISVRTLAKTYTIGHQKIDALNGVSFDVKKGEFIALTGASGSGKSTLLQMIGGLDCPTSGAVLVRDADINRMNDHDLAVFRGQNIGFVFQSFYLQPFLTLQQNLEVPAMFAHVKASERRATIATLVAAVGLSERLNHLPKELSGGQTQRAAIARALLNNPSILLADEPTGNLDSTNSTLIIELFDKIRREFGTTVIVVTHDETIAVQADRIIKLQDGVIV